MARARNIKPGFFTNDELGEVSPLGRLLFIGLWCVADREGRLIDRPKKIKAEVLPYDNCDADELLNELESYGFIKRYGNDKNRFIQIVNFKKHQNPHVKEQESDIPAPDMHGASTVQESVENNESTEVAGLIPSSLIPHTDFPKPKPDKRKPKDTSQQAELFGRFWSEYPRKDARANALKAFIRINPDDQLFEKIMIGLAEAKRSQQWLKDGGQYIPHGATWLNQQRWNDLVDHNGQTHAGDKITQSVAANESEINHRKMLCAIALSDYEEAKKRGDEKLTEWARQSYEKALAALRELCQEAA